MTAIDSSRIDRALRLMRTGPDATAKELADVLWLASVLPEVEAPRPDPVEPKTPDGEQIAKPTPPHPSPGPAKAVAPSVGPRPDANIKIYAPQPGNAEEAFIPATSISVPAADALPNRLAIERAFKPFLKRFPSRRLKQLDTDRTATASADRRAITPIFVPLPERWFEVLLLVEKSNAMEVWTDTVRELQALLGRHGAFRNVRVLRFTVGAEVALFTASGEARPARSAADPDGRRLCLVLTNGTSIEWRRKPLVEFVETLGRRTVVAILQMLPRTTWGHTALGDALERLHSIVPGAPNLAQLFEDPFTGFIRKVEDASCVPAFSLEAAGVGRWAAFVMSPRRIVTPAIQLRVSETPERSRNKQLRRTAERTPVERLAGFRGSASPEAFQLLRVLAGVPLTLPIMRLVQQSVSSSREQSHLAEVMLSGLIERVTPAGSKLAADQVFYDFIPQVREFLLDRLSGREAESLDDVMRPVQERLRAFVEARSDTAGRSFTALLADPEGVEKLPASARAFVEVSRRIYESRGMLPAAPAQARPHAELLQIQPNILTSEPITVAAISGQGNFCISMRHRDLNVEGERRSDVWHREGKSFTQSGGVYNQVAFPQLLTVVDTDEIIGVDGAHGSWTTLVGGKQLNPLYGSVSVQHLEDAINGISPDGAVAVIANAHLVLECTMTTGAITRTYKLDGSVQPVSVAVSTKAIFIAFSDASIRVSPFQRSFSAGAAIRSLCVSRNGLIIFILLESGSVMQAEFPLSDARVTLPIKEATCIGMSSEGPLAAIGHRDGSLTLWDMTRLLVITELHHGPVPTANASLRPVVSVSLSASGAWLLSGSADGLKAWELTSMVDALVKPAAKPQPTEKPPAGPIEQARPKAEAKERTKRTIRLIAETGKDKALTEEVKRALEAAGHTIPDDATVLKEYTVLVSASTLVSYPYPDALKIDSMKDFPRLLDELDREPRGLMYGFPPIPMNPIARPKLEEQLSGFVKNANPPIESILLGGEDTGKADSLLKVLTSDEVRRVFSGGIYWNTDYMPNNRKGRVLTMIDNTSPAFLAERCAVLRLIDKGELPKGAPVFNFPHVSDEEADNHLAVEGIIGAQVIAARKFHHNVPVLVGLAAGAMRRGVFLEGTYVETTKGLFDRGMKTLLDTLDQSALGDLIQFAACLPGDIQSNLVPAPPEWTIKLAYDCGWLVRRADGETGLLAGMRDTVAQLFPTFVAAAHEWICAQYEAREENLRQQAIYGLEHAKLAGGAARMERYLRHRLILADCIRFNLGRVVDRIWVFSAENEFLKNLTKELALINPGPAWDSPPRERIDALLAPARQWPDSSGVPDAQAHGYNGQGIRVAIPVTDWNQAHPEFLGRPVYTGLPMDSDSFSASIGSVIAGLHIGVAPAVQIEPIPVELRRVGEMIWIKDLTEALQSLLDDPPDIVCITPSTTFDGKLRQPSPREYSPELHTVVMELVKRDVLVVVSAGNRPEELSEPAIYPEVLSVGFCDFTGVAAEQSSRGTFPGNVESRVVPDIYGYGIGVNVAAGPEGYAPASGSAYGAAYVAGIAALYAQATGLRGENLKDLLIERADPSSRVARFDLWPPMVS